jgi:hypothetical protein
MIRLFLQNLRIRLLEWLRKPKKADVPRWTLKEIQALDETPRRPVW